MNPNTCQVQEFIGPLSRTAFCWSVCDLQQIASLLFCGQSVIAMPNALEFSMVAGKKNLMSSENLTT